MAKFVLKDGFVSVDGTNLSNRASSVTIEEPADEVESTTFGGDFHEFMQGLKDATITVAFFQDYAVGSVHKTLGPIHTSGATCALAIRATSAVASTTNPQWNMTARLFNYTPLAAAVGEAVTMDVVFRNAAGTGITEALS